MSEKNVEHLEAIDTLAKAKGFWEKFKKPVLYIGTAIILLGSGYIAYNKYVAEPNEKSAAEAIFKAQEYFAADSLNKALNGDGQAKGFLYIIKNYGSTPTGNLANFYAGVSYLRLKDFKNAVKYLEDFSTSSKLLQATAYAKLGDAYSEQGKNDDALEYYKKAARHFEADEAGSSEYLFRAGYLAESLNKNSEALELYKELKEKYPKTEKGFQIDKYIYRLSVEKNEFSVK